MRKSCVNRVFAASGHTQFEDTKIAYATLIKIFFMFLILILQTVFENCFYLQHMYRNVAY
jgi:hypothetical protein